MIGGKAIGGYFELELPSGGKHFHERAIRLNTARCAFEYILRAKNYRRVYIPYYTCDAILEPIQRLGLEYEFYRIDEQLEPIFDTPIASDETFLYTNYYGIKQDAVERVVAKFDNVIIDNSQAFFAPVIDGIDTFYSARKFFGVADGAFLYTDKLLDITLETDISCERMSHLLKRFELGAQTGYADFSKNDRSLSGESIKLMSVLTQKLLENINYVQIQRIRKENFESLHRILHTTNRLIIQEPTSAMIYPYWNHQSGLRERLIDAKIFVAKYWANVELWAKEGLELDLVNNLIPLPIDQRYNHTSMDKITEIIKNNGI